MSRQSSLTNYERNQQESNRLFDQAISANTSQSSFTRNRSSIRTSSSSMSSLNNLDQRSQIMDTSEARTSRISEADISIQTRNRPITRSFAKQCQQQQQQLIQQQNINKINNTNQQPSSPSISSSLSSSTSSLASIDSFNQSNNFNNSSTSSNTLVNNKNNNNNLNINNNTNNQQQTKQYFLHLQQLEESKILKHQKTYQKIIINEKPCNLINILENSKITGRMIRNVQNVSF